MTPFVRTAFSYVLAAALLLGGTAMAPDSVLCLGPGNHCHFETVVAASCSERVPASSNSAPRDGCPRGSKDFRVGLDTHRCDNNFVATAFAQVLSMATALLEPFAPLRRAPEFFRFPHAQDAAILTVILRC